MKQYDLKGMSWYCFNCIHVFRDGGHCVFPDAIKERGTMTANAKHCKYHIDIRNERKK